MFDRYHAPTIYTWILVLYCLNSLSTISNAQTLSERLIQEDKVKLAEQAIQQGNIVRGAILFHQGNINCIKCHRANQGSQPIAPDLSLIDAATTDATIVESILQPSKVIHKGYETVQILTQSGSVIVGTPLKQTDQVLVLRSLQNPEELTTIRLDEIEEKKPSDVSSMPSGLVDQLKDRQQFLDLVRYVIEIRRRGTNEPIPTAPASTTRELDQVLKGLTLIRNKNCIACHKTQANLFPFVTSNAPDLKWSAKRLNPIYLERYLLSPHTTKAGSNMPDLLHTLNPEERAVAAKSLIVFLLTRDGNEYHMDHKTSEPEAIRRGHELFHSIGCVACHAPRNVEGAEQALAGSTPLGDLTSKFDSSSLVEFLENPHIVRPFGRMPNLQLSHREALDLASFLLQGVDHAANPPTSTTADDSREEIEKGKQLFAQFGCASCHSDVITPQPSTDLLMAPPDWSSVTHSSFERGCLSGETGTWPDFHLSPEERMDLQTACRSGSKPLNAHEKIDWTLATFQCTACHSRDGLGGVSVERNAFFQTTNLNLGDQGRIPPSLSGVGAKLQEKWMREVLTTGRAIRPYMKTRMPQFGENNIGHLVELFQGNDLLPPIDHPAVENRDTSRKLGHEIVGNQGLNCVACHTYQYKQSDTMPAVDLTEMAERLKKDWFHKYMLAPQKFSPNTVMPSFWPGGRAIRPDISGDAATQIEAIWQYLLDGRQANAPRGVIREPLEIVVRDHARLLRRSYEGIGKRGIGVGYPGDVNLAFDAEQLRLAMIWPGKFVDPAGVWYGQGHGNVRTLGRPIQLPRGPELDDATSPWEVDDNRPTKHRFLGYQLDSKRRPTFQYEFDGVKVHDFFTENAITSDKPADLLRSLKLFSEKEHPNLRFRVAQGNVTKVDAFTYRLEGGIILRIKSPREPLLSSEGSDNLVQIPIDLSAGQTIEFSIEYHWD